MTEANLRYENEQLKRKLLQTQEERDRAMSNCHELWKRLNSLISLAASTTANYTHLSNSGLPTSPSDSYDSRSKSTSPNSSSAASLNDSLLSTSNGTTTSSSSTAASAHLNMNGTTNSNSSAHNNNNNNQQQATNNNNNNNNNITTQQTKLSNATNTPLNLKSVNAITKSNNSSNIFHTSTLPQLNTNASNNNNNNTSTPTQQQNNHHTNTHLNNHTPLNLKSVNAIKDINNNHPLIAEVAKVTTVGEIEEIAPGQFKCRYCDKTFDRIFSVHRHERVHTGFKPCVCKACGRGFSEKRNLRHHIIRFHSDGSGRELLKRNRNKSAQQAAAAAGAAVAQHQQHAHVQREQQHLHHQQQVSLSAVAQQAAHLHREQQREREQQQQQQQQSDSFSSQITATINRLQNIKNEPIDTSGLNVLGAAAAAAVITVSSSSSRRRKSKPSKKINNY